MMGVPNPFIEFVELVLRMRTAQSAYFRTKTKQNLDVALKLERDVDNAITSIRRPVFGDRIAKTAERLDKP